MKAPTAPARTGPATVAVREVSRSFGRRSALVDVSFDAVGGVVTLLGPNGAGKTTLLRCLATVLGPDRGSIHVDGLDPRDEHERVRIRRRVGYLPQNPAFAARATVFDVVDHLAILKEIGPARVRHGEVVRVLRDVGLTDRLTTRIGALSGGMVRRVGIAQALLGRPGLVLLDEPAAGLDPEQRLRLRERLSLVGETATVVLSTHLIDEAATFSQALLVLHDGRIVYRGTPAALTATAAGRVWTAPVAPPAHPSVRVPYRVPDGRYRSIGDPPPGASLEPPTLEDAYLLLVGAGPTPPWR
jgi:ABC-2 type transport system ATP-binding protein